MGRRRVRAWTAAAALALGASLFVGCGGGDTPSAVVPSPAVSASPFDLGTIERSVAYIQTQGTFVTADGAAEQVYSGSGFVIDPSGLIVTNNHVVAGGAFWKVQVGTDDTLLDARLLGVSECSDLAVLKVEGTFPALRLASAHPRVGDPIYVAGHPNGEPYTLTNGIVAKPPHPDDTSWASVKEEIQITAQTYPGNSGSPVVNTAGEVVAVHYAGGAPGSNIAGQSFAISAAEAAPIIEKLKAGVSLDTVGLNGQADTGRQGIAIVSVVPGSPADRAGIEPGDVLTNFNGVAVGVDGTKATYCSVLRTHSATDVLSVTVTRNGIAYKGEINGRELARTGGGATPGPSAGPSSGTSAAIDLIEAYVPPEIWHTCEHSTDSVSSTVLQTAACDPGGGVTGAWYDLYDSAGSLAAAIDADATRHDTSTGTACDAGAYRGTWQQTLADGTIVTSDAHVLLCYTDSGNAWIEQADPVSHLLYWVEWKGGSQGDLFSWWKKNATIVLRRPGG